MLSQLLRLALPAPCLGCRRPLDDRAARLGLCGACRARLRPDGPGARGLQLPGGGRLLAAWVYAPPLDAVVAGLKFQRLDWLGAHLAAALLERLGTALPPADAVVPVPLHWRRRLLRGYNQAEEIARPLAARLGLPCRRLLRRARATAPQTGLDRARRRRNPSGAFRAAATLRGERLLLVDDVVTTGSTLAEAARCLREAGAGAVTAVAAARALP